MNANEVVPCLPVPQSLIERIGTEVLAALRSAELAVAGLWKRDAGPPADRHAYDSIEQLDERTLKDIGAPHWLVARAAARREAQHLRWLELDLR
jgi:hypothetical protein